MAVIDGAAALAARQQPAARHVQPAGHRDRHGPELRAQATEARPDEDGSSAAFAAMPIEELQRLHDSVGRGARRR